MLGIIQLIHFVFQIYTLMLFARILSSWVPQLQEYRLMQFVSYYTDPYLNLFRRIIPPLGMFDLSPIVAFISLSIFQSIVINLLQKLS